MADLSQMTCSRLLQLRYLAQDPATLKFSSEPSDEEANLASLPPAPDYIPTNVIKCLYSIPVSNIRSLENVRESMYSHREEWEAFLSNEDKTSLPWQSKKKTDNDGSEGELDDLVILKALSPERWNTHLNDAVTTAIQSQTSTPLLLSEVITKMEDIAATKSSPTEAILLVYDDSDLLSQSNMTQLEPLMMKTFAVSEWVIESTIENKGERERERASYMYNDSQVCTSHECFELDSVFTSIGHLVISCD